MNKYVKTFENFLDKISKNNKYQGLENLSKSKYGNGNVDKSTEERILNIDNFNRWFKEECTSFGGNGEPDLFGRRDKLSWSVIEDYFYAQGVECDEEEIHDFHRKVEENWMGK